MSYRTPAGRLAAVKETRDALLASRRTVLTTHLNADGDGAGSEAAVASWLRANGTEVWIINPTPFPDQFRFLIESEDCIVPAGSPKARDLCEQVDLAVVLDTGEVPRIGRVRDLIRDLPTVVIDHHPPGAQSIGGVSLRDATASATGELVYDIIAAANGPWTSFVASGIYIAILTDTGSFRFSNATPGAHEIVAHAIRMGVDPEEMHERVYGAAPLRRYELLRHALESLDHDPAMGVSWMTIPTEWYEQLGATAEDLEGMVDIPRSIEGTQVGLLFRGTKSGEVKISFRSNGPIDVNVLARRFDGGGHVKASGAMVAGEMEDVIESVLAATRDAVTKMLATGGAGR